MALSDSSKRMISLLPSWMEVYKDPTSAGAKFIDVPGNELTNLSDLAMSLLNNTAVSTADLSQIDIIYRSEYFDVIDDSNLTVTAYIGTTEYAATDAKTLYNFYQTQLIDHPRFIYDKEDNSIYLRFKYDYLVINGTKVYDQRVHHVWNSFDEIGLMIGCQRLYGENNSDYASRMRRSIMLGKGTTRDLVSGNVAIDLGVQDIEVKSMTDPAFINTMLNDKGEPTQKLLDYVRVISDNMNQLWDTGVWDKTLWDTIEKDKTGLNYIPHVWSIPEDYAETLFKSGIGDGDDLLITIPNEENINTTVRYSVGIKGVKITPQNIYPSRTFKYKILASGSVATAEAKPEEYKYTVVASPRIPIEADIVASAAYIQQSETDMEDVNFVNVGMYDMLTDEQKETYGFFQGTKLLFRDGNAVPHPNARYIKIRATLKGDGTSTPSLTNITLRYAGAGGGKTVVIENRNDVQNISGAMHVGFTTNNLSSSDAILSAGNTSNLELVGNELRLVKGQYKHNVETSDWRDTGEKTNIEISSSGIFLNI